MNVITQLILISCLIILNAYFAASEVALISIRSSRIKQLSDEGNKKAKLILNLISDPSKFLATIQVGITFTGMFASAVGAVTLAEVTTTLLTPFVGAATAKGLSVMIVTIVITVVTLLYGELIPKRMAIQRAESIAMFVAPQIHIFATITAPMVKTLALITNFTIKLLDGSTKNQEDNMSEEELLMLVTEQDNLRKEEKDMIHGVFEFSDTIAREIMIPRTDINAIKIDSTLTEIITIAQNTGHSRLPIYDENLDNIIGILAVKDIMDRLINNNQKEFSLKDYIRPVYCIPESKKIVDLFKELKNKRQQMAIVIDEYGGTAGLITLEDLLEEIVGDINDEHDPQSTDIQIENNQAIVNGGVNIEDVNNELNLSLPDTEYYETISGFILHKLGKIPKTGEELIIDTTLLKIAEMEGHRITKVIITKHIQKNAS